MGNERVQARRVRLNEPRGLSPRGASPANQRSLTFDTPRGLKPAARCVRSYRGFTLIEILVVVAIIALLISILLPSLKRARDQARSAVCAANVGNICRAEATYQMSNQEWIPGSPLTTGFYWAYVTGESLLWHPFVPHFNRFVVEWFDFSTPLRATMQGSGTIPRAKSASSAEFDRTRAAMFMQMTEDVFHCPSNGQLATPHGNKVGPDGIKAVSYLTMNTITRGGGDVFAHRGKFKNYQGKGSNIGQQGPNEPLPGWEVRVPNSYLPRHSRLGRENMKVFVADGLRFYDKSGVGPPITYFTDPAMDNKGIMSGAPPSTAPPFDREYGDAGAYSWRHGDSNRINAGFFDGHVEALQAEKRSGGSGNLLYRGNAVHPKYYFPSGSIVMDPSRTNAPDIPAGMELP